jgi:alcohol dehydrogenase class IV
LTLSLPPAITAFTGVDALTHAIEAYTNKYAQPFVDTFALEAVRLIGRNLRQAVHCGTDEEARCNMALASLYGGMCLGPVCTAAVHALAYPLGGTFNVPHGVANSLLLPHVMAFNAPSAAARYTDVARALGEAVDGLTDEDAAALAVEAVRRLCVDVGIVSRIRDLDVPEDAIPAMAEAAMLVTRLLANNPREVTLEDAANIYRSAY